MEYHGMRFIQFVTGVLLGLKIVFWGAVIVGGVYFTPEIKAFAEGAAARFDYAIGYGETQG